MGNFSCGKLGEKYDRNGVLWSKLRLTSSFGVLDCSVP